MRPAGGILLAVGCLYLGYGVDRQEFWSLLLAFAVSFSGYCLAVRSGNKDRLFFWIGVGVALRLALVFAFPRLSDDVYRFIWDGQLALAGVSPFAELPSYYLHATAVPTGLDLELFPLLNSPEYFTIYPPVAQAVFTLAAWIGGQSWYAAAVVMKLFLFACELGSLWAFWHLLPRFGLARERLLLYWLNPLIIVEIVGNLHFEGAMVCFLLLSLHALSGGKEVYKTGLAAGSMALSIGSKLLPLMLLPFLVKRLWWRRFWVFSLVLGVALVLLFSPFLFSGFLEGFGSSLDLYFRKFEFNASLYYLARAYGYYEIGWNQIARFGPLLAMLAAGLILFLALVEHRRRWSTLPSRWMWAFTIYLLCATTVHPWYLAVPIALCVFTRWRFPLVWSFLIMLTYTSYVSEPYRENLWLVCLEYSIVVAVAWWEWKMPKRHKLTGWKQSVDSSG